MQFILRARSTIRLLSWRQWVVAAAVFYFVIAPLLTLIHELGHAIPALLQGHPAVTVVIGDRAPALFQLNALSFEIGSIFYPWYGATYWDGPDANLPALLGGPIASLLTFVTLFFAWRRLGSRLSPMANALLFASLGWSLWQFIGTAVPMQHPAWLPGNPFKVSDGYQILEHFLR